jgi:hypothetical protein
VEGTYFAEIVRIASKEAMTSPFLYMSYFCLAAIEIDFEISMKRVAEFLGFSKGRTPILGIGLVAIVLYLAPISVTSIFAQNITGEWEGTITEFGVAVQLHLDANGGGTLDDITHNGKGILLQYFLIGNSVNITIPSVQASFQGIVGKNEIAGRFSQRGRMSPLTLSHASTDTQESPTGADSAIGDWYGIVADSVEIMIHLKQGGVGTVDDITHSSPGIVMQSSLIGNALYLAMPSIDAMFQGTILNNRIIGVFTQRGRSYKLSLIRRHSIK